MRRLKHYIGTRVLGAILVVMVVILSLDMIAMLVDELDQLDAQYTFVEALVYCLLQLPASVYEMLPLASLVGCLTGLGLLANTAELTVIRAAGVALPQLIWAVMRPVLLLIVIGSLLGEYALPTLHQYAESRRAQALGHATALAGQRGVWSLEGNAFLHFGTVLPNGKLLGTTRMEFDERGQLLRMSYVDSAIFQRDHWFEQGGASSQLLSDRIVTETYPSRTWHSAISPKLLSVIAQTPDELPMQKLLPYASYIEKQGQDGARYRLAFWQKALQPLATLSLVMIAISFIFGPLRQVTMGFRIFSGVLVGIIFQTSQDLLGPSSLLFGFAPWVAVAVPIIVSLLVGGLLLKRAT
jgi:lipopolysaccharide export system permease protein